ncbi:MFS transporter [Natronomonas sp. EA1]|uniref:MFS transporter n=1 Tax=Natronomonas sp. EA1 TaxID=3421655 RepID=UPI003EC0EFC1
MTTQAWRAVGAVSGWQAAASLCYYAVFAATTYFREAFGISRTLVGVLVTVTTLGYTLNLFPSGAFVDGFGEKRVMLAGLAALAAGTTAIALSPTFAVLLVAGLLLGMAYATAMPASNKGIVANAPAGSENLAMGLKQVGVTVGSGAASLVIAGVASVVAWQWGFGVIAVLALLYGIVFAVAYEGTGGVGELRVPDTRSLAGNRTYLLLAAAGFFIGATVFTTIGYTVLYVDEAVGASAAVAGVVLAVTQVTGSVGRIGAGGLADRVGGARGAATVTLAQAVPAVGIYLLLARGAPSLPVAVVLFAGLGLTILGLTGVYYSTMGEVVASEEIGAATAGGQTALNAGGLVAPALFGVLADSVGYEAGWTVLAVFMASAAGFIALVRRRV